MKTIISSATIICLYFAVRMIRLLKDSGQFESQRHGVQHQQISSINSIQQGLITYAYKICGHKNDLNQLFLFDLFLKGSIGDCLLITSFRSC